MGFKRGSNSFSTLAVQILQEADKPMTAREVWRYAEAKGLVELLGSRGKTPADTLAAYLYTEVKKPDSPFTKIGARPTRFLMKEKRAAMGKIEIEREIARDPEEMKPSKPVFHERDLHPLLVWFADRHLGASCRTIFHEKSSKRGAKHDQWVHPDLVGFSLPTQDWSPSVVELAHSSGAPKIKLYSFEMKISLDFGNLRECFFQAVSNSSWSHEGYLVALEIDDSPEFQDELRRLSQSFGIGVIRLSAEGPESIGILLPARERSEVDWETVNRVASINKDFAEFIDSTVKSIRINQPAGAGFDPLLEDEALRDFVKKLSLRNR